MARLIRLTAAVLSIAALAVVAQTTLVDLDIAGFRAAKRSSLKKAKPIRIKLVIQNMGVLDEPRSATVVGVQNSSEFYNQTLQVSDAPGKGPTTFAFPSYVAVATGDIIWTVTLDDDDPDDDTALAVTKVVP
jgi:hypothetical protein